MGVDLVPLTIGASFDIVLHVLIELGPPVVPQY